MASLNSSSVMKTLEVCKIAPSSEDSEFSVPLTFFDLLWFKFHPVERLFFYSLPQSDTSFFLDSVIPKLKRSLSLTLQNFLLLAGNITWPPQSDKPIIQYTPGDGVSLIIAESEADFNLLSGNQAHEAIASHHLVPHLDISDSLASTIALQVTLFPNTGFCIGISAHHAVMDGISSSMFLKAWAYICRTIGEEEFCSSSLPAELKPFFDRSVIKDQKELDMFYLKSWTALAASHEPNLHKERSLRLLSITGRQNQELVRATFNLIPADLDKLKKRVLTQWDKINEEEGETKPVKMSTFVVTCAYVVVCMGEVYKDFAFAFSANCRARLNPPVDPNYFGNCVFPCIADIEPEEFSDEQRLALVAKKIYNLIKKLQTGAVVDEAEDLFAKFASLASKRIIGVAGSNQFGVYGIDFGWARPTKVEITSVDITGSIALAESRDGNGGVEVGLVFTKDEMELFASVFYSGLEAIPK
ncbi:Phenolic glucoside malonyltransferase [Quillaja saponaria]|uniref:Phenolic glucoside malonyltransferase n=1 Tax=Quillaja saponaria TaxID=32244 RepID=A0AAD7VG31_QUISA|nr:Phenolic glucoside malonyltransferase [Quillaja saponaria]